MKIHKDKYNEVSHLGCDTIVWYSRIFLIQHPWDQRGVGLSGSTSTDPNSYRYLFVTVPI